MEDHRNSVLEWPYLHKEKSTEELAQSLWLTTMELEATRTRVQEQIRARDDQLNQLKHLLNDAIKERDEAHSKYQSILLDKLLLHQQLHQHHRYTHHQTTTPLPQSGISSIEDEPITNCGFSSSDCEESIVSSPPIEHLVQLPPPPQELRFPVVPTKGLPEKGKFLEAMMKAGPLLQNLLLAGPLPHWRHPPPPLDTYQIPSPPLMVSTPTSQHLFNQDFSRKFTNNCAEFNNKRGFSEDCDSSTDTKYPRIALN